MSQQMRTLVEERADLQALLQEQSRNLTALNKRLGVAQRDNEDLVQSQVDCYFSLPCFINIYRLLSFLFNRMMPLISPIKLSSISMIPIAHGSP